MRYEWVLRAWFVPGMFLQLGSLMFLLSVCEMRELRGVTAARTTSRDDFAFFCQPNLSIHALIIPLCFALPALPCLPVIRRFVGCDLYGANTGGR